MLDTKLETIKNKYLNFQEDEELVESINDPYLFKAIILAGSPGAGKSYIVKKAFPRVQIVNSDDIFEYFLEKNNLSKIIDSNAPDYEKKMELRNTAKKLTAKRESLWINGMLPIIIDGTGKDDNRIKGVKEWLEFIGYDVYMVLVDVSLETAKRRNKERERSVDEKTILIPTWEAIQIHKKKGTYEKLFGNNFFIIPNDDDSNVPESYFNKLFQKTIASPLENPKGKDILQKLKEIGGKYLIDLDIEKLKDTLDSPKF